MSPGFARHQLKKLATALDPARVQSREQDGKTLSYIEGWFVIAEANRIFGYDGWDREMVHFERVFERNRRDGTECAYVARVRVRVRAADTAILREGTGFGQASAAKAADAHERALKAAETDATKRALVTFGGRFGLMLYDKDQRPRAGTAAQNSLAGGSCVTGEAIQNGEGTKTVKGKLPAEAPAAAVPIPTPAKSNANRPDGETIPAGPCAVEQSDPHFRLIASDGSVTELRSPEGFCSGLRQLLEAARDENEVIRLRHHNAGTILALRDLAGLTTQRGEHYADILERLFSQRANELANMANPAAVAESAPRSELLATSDADEGSQSLGPAQANDAQIETSSISPAYGPFVPVPDYPLAGLRERIVRQGRPAQHLQRAPEVRRGVAKDVGTVQLKSEPVPTRRSQITGGFSIDKSALLIPSERRLRSKAHLQLVASKPCLVCEALPCHAHHVTFAQARGLSQKVSDEYTVPLCALHHNELHAFGNELSWWREKAIEPLPAASELWRQTWLQLTPSASD